MSYPKEAALVYHDICHDAEQFPLASSSSKTHQTPTNNIYNAANDSHKFHRTNNHLFSFVSLSNLLRTDSNAFIALWFSGCSATILSKTDKERSKICLVLSPTDSTTFPYFHMFFYIVVDFDGSVVVFKSLFILTDF